MSYKTNPSETNFQRTLIKMSKSPETTFSQVSIAIDVIALLFTLFLLATLSGAGADNIKVSGKFIWAFVVMFGLSLAGVVLNSMFLNDGEEAKQTGEDMIIFNSVQIAMIVILSVASRWL